MEPAVISLRMPNLSTKNPETGMGHVSNRIKMVNTSAIWIGDLGKLFFHAFCKERKGILIVRYDNHPDNAGNKLNPPVSGKITV